MSGVFRNASNPDTLLWPGLPAFLKCNVGIPACEMSDHPSFQKTTAWRARMSDLH